VANPPCGGGVFSGVSARTCVFAFRLAEYLYTKKYVGIIRRDKVMKPQGSARLPTMHCRKGLTAQELASTIALLSTVLSTVSVDNSSPGSEQIPDVAGLVSAKFHSCPCVNLCSSYGGV
jgi:hypothetical protein